MGLPQMWHDAWVRAMAARTRSRIAVERLVLMILACSRLSCRRSARLSLLFEARADHVDDVVGPVETALVVQQHRQRVCVQLVVVLVRSAVLLHRCVLRC